MKNWEPPSVHNQSELVTLKTQLLSIMNYKVFACKDTIGKLEKNIQILEHSENYLGSSRREHVGRELLLGKSGLSIKPYQSAIRHPVKKWP